MVTDKHRAFMQALAKLAREHDMDNIRIHFRLGFNVRAQEIGAPLPREAFEEVTATWSTGRHGVAGSIRIETRSTQEIPEAKS